MITSGRKITAQQSVPSARRPESLLPPEVFPRGVTRLPYRSVVGVIEDFRQNGLDREANPEVFVPISQLPTGAWKEQFAQEFASTHFLIVRTVGDPLAITGAIQATLSRLDPDLAIADVRTMENRLAESMAQRRFAMLLLSSFAGLALVLALVGLYAVIAYSVSQRHKEFGVRAALGASAGSLLRMVLADGLRMTVSGAVIGLLLAAALSRFMTSQLFQIRAIDPVVYGGVTLLLVAVLHVAPQHCAAPASTRLPPSAVNDAAVLTWSWPLGHGRARLC